MFWIIQYPSIQILLTLWIIQLIYTAYATINGKINESLKAFLIVLLFVTMYSTVTISNTWLGFPSFTDDEVVGTLDGYDKMAVEGKTMLAVMVTTKTGPFMFVIPYNPKVEKDLSTSMNKKVTTGKPTVIRKKSSAQLELEKDKEEQDAKAGNKAGLGKGGPQSGFDSSEMEFYDFTDQLLLPKSQDNGK